MHGSYKDRIIELQTISGDGPVDIPIHNKKPCIAIPTYFLQISYTVGYN